jgi:hypothetical protein
VSVPVTDALNTSFSEEPPAFEVTLKEPVNLRVPETRAYLPDPPVTFASAFTVTLVGVLVPDAQPCELDDEMTLNLKVPPAPLRLPRPATGSH